MKNLTKKILIYSLVAIMQITLGASVIEASPSHNSKSQEHQRYEKTAHQQDDRERRIKEENERHEREMKRREHEDERAWHERQEREKERHERVLREIGGAVLLYLLLKD